jgi:hypothetical protein
MPLLFVQPNAEGQQRERAIRVRISSVNQLLSTALRIMKTTPRRTAKPPIQAIARPYSRSNSIREIECSPGGGGGAAV